MNRRQKIIVSVVGIFIVLLALVGLTYAYFLTQIKGNTNNKSISVTTANLRLVYGGDDGSIIGADEIIEPGTTFAPKEFTVTNEGNEKIDSYAVVIENFGVFYNDEEVTTINGVETTYDAGTVTTLSRPQDFELVITCTDQDKNPCTGFDGTLPSQSDILITNPIEVGETHTYTATLKYVEAGLDQSEDMNKRIEGKFNIIGLSDTVDLTGKVINYTAGDYVQTNSTKRISTIKSDGTYKVLGLEAGDHTIKVCGKNDTNCESPKMTQTITIVQGEVASGDNANKTITITDLSRTANVDVNVSAGTISIGKTINEKFYWYKDGDQIKCSNCDIVYTIGDKVNYTDTGLKSGETVSIDSLYDTNDPYKTQHYVNGGSNADLATGTINRTEFDWIVMGIKDSETLLITTPKNYYVSVTMKMDDVTPLNVIDEQFSYTKLFLDNIVRAAYGSEARSIKASDVNGILNYQPTGGVTHSGEGENVISLNNFTTKVKDIPTSAYSSLLEKALPVYFNNGNCTDKTACIFDFDNHLINGYFYDISEENVMTPVVDPGKTITDLEWEVLLSSENSTLDADKQGYWLNDLGLRISDSSKIYYGFGTVFRQIGTDFLRMFLPIDSFKSVGSNRTYNKVLRPVIEVKNEVLEKIS